MSDCRHDAPTREPNAGDVQTQRQQLDEQKREMMLDKLIDCLYSFEDESDMAALDRCLDELSQADGSSEDFDVEQGLKDFHARFGDAFVSRHQEVKKPARYRRPLARIAIIAAALCAFVFTAQASGLDIIGAIARWTSEQFSFVKVNDEKDMPPENLKYTTLEQALSENGITDRLAPAWFPSGTKVDWIRVSEGTGEIAFLANYKLNGEKFFISIQQINNTPLSEVEINDPSVEIYAAGGIEHFIMTDVEQNKVTWYNGLWECYIAGNIERELLLKMVDSIYE